QPLALADVPLPRIVRAVGKPETEQVRTRRPGDPDAAEDVVERAPPDRPIAVGERPELVALVLKDVGVDGADAQAPRPGAGRDLGGVNPRGEVPERVNGNRRAAAGQAVHLRSVRELVVDGDRRAVLQELAE